MRLDELKQVNAIVGLSKRIEGWPSTLLDLGYELERLELKLSLSVPTKPGVLAKVTPDLCFLAEKRNYSLLVELKSGTFQDFTQPDKLIRVTPLDLFRYGGVPILNLIGHKISVAVIINEEFLGEYQSEFERVSHKACLVSIGEFAIKSEHGNLVDDKANGKFKRGIDIPKRPPSRLIPILPTTDDKPALFRSIADAVKLLWLNNEHSIGPLSISKEIFKQIWGAIDNEAQKQFLSFARQALVEMSGAEFRPYMRPLPEGARQETRRISVASATRTGRAKIPDS